MQDERLATALHSAGNLVAAVAFGQLKITGSVDAESVSLALAAIEREALVVDHYERHDPTWTHGASARMAVSLKRSALAKLATLAVARLP